MQDHTRTDLVVDNRFAMIPHWVILSNISDGALRLYAVLMKYADGATKQAFPSRRRLAEDMHKSVKSVDRHLKELVELGAVHVQRRKREGSYENRTSVYTVITANPNVAPAVSLPGDADDAGIYTHLSTPTVSSSYATDSLQDIGDQNKSTGTALHEQLGISRNAAKYLIDRTVATYRNVYDSEELEEDIYEFTQIDVSDSLANRRWDERLVELIERSPSPQYGAAAWLAQICNWTRTN